MESREEWNSGNQCKTVWRPDDNEPHRLPTAAAASTWMGKPQRDGCSHARSVCACARSVCGHCWNNVRREVDSGFIHALETPSRSSWLTCGQIGVVDRYGQSVSLSRDRALSSSSSRRQVRPCDDPDCRGVNGWLYCAHFVQRNSCYSPVPVYTAKREWTKMTGNTLSKQDTHRQRLVFLFQ
jgi:hypothetical protein